MYRNILFSLFLMEHRLNHFINQPVTDSFLDHVATQASTVINCRTSPMPDIPTLNEFVKLLARRSCPGTLLATLVLLDRFKQAMAQRDLCGGPDTCHRIFLSTLVITSKCIHDVCRKNKRWTEFHVIRRHFSTREITLMERQLLQYLVTYAYIHKRTLLLMIMKKDFRVVIREQDLNDVFSLYLQSQKQTTKCSDDYIDKPPTFGLHLYNDLPLYYFVSTTA